MKWRNVLFDSILILIFIIVPHIGILPMYVFPFVILTIIWLYLKRSDENFKSLRFSFKELTIRSILAGAITGISYAFAVLWIIGPLISLMGFAPINLDDFAMIRNNYVNYAILMIMAWVLVIPFEEILFRGFIFTRIRNWFENPIQAFYFSSMITTLLFAGYHYQEGAGAVLQIFIFGLIQMAIYRQVNGNLWYLIFFHAFYDTVMLTAILKGYL